MHDFTYEWDGKSRNGAKPITWFPGAYRVRVVKLVSDDAPVHFLFPMAVLLKPVLKKDAAYQSLKNYIHNFAEKLAAKYPLDIHKTLWVEVRDDSSDSSDSSDSVRIAHLNPDRKLSDITLFSFTWRQARPGELTMLAPFLEDF